MSSNSSVAEPLSSFQLLQAVSSTSSWQNFSFPAQAGEFVLDFDVIPSANSMGGTMSLSSGQASSSSPVAIQFTSQGTFEALDGSNFSSIQNIPYTAEQAYHIQLDINVAAQTYNVIVTPDGSIAQILASQYTFGAAASSLDNFGIESTSGSFEIFNVQLSIPLSTSTPVSSTTPTSSTTPAQTVASNAIMSVNSNLCLEAVNGATANGTAIDQGGCSQNWTLQAAGNGQYSIVSQASGRCLDVTGSSTADGGQVELWDCTGWSNQLWTLNQVSSGVYTIVNVNSGKCLDVTGMSKASGTLVEQWTCTGEANQQWQVSGVPTGTQASTPAASTPAASTPATSTAAAGSVLPSHIVLTYYWPWGTHPSMAQIMAQAPQYNVLVYANAIASGNGNANMVLNGGAEPGLASEIASWEASGRVAMLCISHDGVNGATINLITSSDVTNFVNSVSALINTYHFQGIDWDLEDSFTVSSQSAVVSASAQLKAMFGPNFIISAVPRDYEVRNNGIWAQAMKAMGNNLDFLTLQEYDNAAYADPQFAQIKADYADLIGQGFPANKVLLGTATDEGSNIGTSVQGGAATAAVYANALTYLVQTYGIRGTTVWQSASDGSDGWDYAISLGHVFGF